MLFDWKYISTVTLVIPLIEERLIGFFLPLTIQNKEKKEKQVITGKEIQGELSSENFRNLMQVLLESSLL